MAFHFSTQRAAIHQEKLAEVLQFWSRPDIPGVIQKSAALPQKVVPPHGLGGERRRGMQTATQKVQGREGAGDEEGWEICIWKGKHGWGGEKWQSTTFGKRRDVATDCFFFFIPLLPFAMGEQ